MIMYFQRKNMFLFKLISLVSLIVITGCASGKVTNRQSNVQNEQIPRPNQIFVHDFAVTTDEISQPLIIDGNVIIQNSTQSVEEIRRAKLLAVEIANDLVADISDMGLRAFHAGSNNKPQPGDIVLKGQFLTIDEGSKAKRVLIGFGAGSGELTVRIEGYQVTFDGLRKLGSSDITAAGGKKPGALVPALVAVATDSPVGLIVSSALSIKGEKKDGSETLEGASKRVAKVIAKELEAVFKSRRWI
jgi:hypothetical protein